MANYQSRYTGPEIDERLRKAGEAVLTEAQSLDAGKQAQARENIGAASSAAVDGKYTKPSGGIPKADLASGVQASLGKADAAYQKPASGIPASDIAEGVIPDVSQFVTKSVNDLANYYLKTETYTKDEVQQLISTIQGFEYEVVTTLPAASADTMGKIYLVPSADPQSQNIKDEYITIDNGASAQTRYTWEQIGSTAVDLSGYVTTQQLNTALAAYTTSTDLATLLAAKQDVINDLADIRSGAAAGATAYQKPQAGIPATDLADKYAGSPSAGGPAFKALGIPYGAVDANSTATDIKATVDNFPETLVAGVCAYIRNDIIASASGFTLNINGTGALPVYSTMSDASRATTAFTATSTYLFVYNPTRVEGGCWDIYFGYNSDTNTIGYNLRTNGITAVAAAKFYRYRLLFTSPDGHFLIPSNTSSSTNATAARAVNQAKIDPFAPIWYYSTTTAIEANAGVSASYLWMQYSAIPLGYAFNRTGAALTMTARYPVYLKCAPQSDGSAIMDADTPIVQALPSTEDGKIYIFLGYAESAVNITLYYHHPVYYFKDGAIRQWTNAAAASVTVDQTYDGTSANAQSGVAMAGALAGKQDTIDASHKLDYSLLSNTPTIPAAQVNSDWNAGSGVAQILNKPNLATVATSGSYDDLSNKPVVDATPTANSNNLVKSGGVFGAIEDVMEAIDGTNVETVTVLPTASASTVGKIYYVGPDGNGEYARYRGIESGGSYSFLPLGSTAMDLTDYATKEELSQLDQVLEIEDHSGTVTERIPYAQHYGYINGNSITNQTASSNYRYTDPIFIKAGESLKIKAITTSNVGRLASYNPDTQAVTQLLVGQSASASSASDAYENTYVAESDIWLIVGYCWNKFSLELTKIFYKTDISSRINDVDAMEEVLEMEHDTSIVTEDIPLEIVEGEYYDGSVGGKAAISTSASYCRSLPFAIHKGETLEIKATTSGSISVFVIQDGENMRAMTYQSGETIVNYEVPVDGFAAVSYQKSKGISIKRTYTRDVNSSARLDGLEEAVAGVVSLTPIVEDVADIVRDAIIDDLTTGLTDGYYIAHNGVISPNDSFAYKEFVVSCGAEIVFKATAHPNIAAISKKISTTKFQELVPATSFSADTFTYTAAEDMIIAVCFDKSGTRSVSINTQNVASNRLNIVALQQKDASDELRDIDLGFFFDKIAVIGDSMAVATMDGYSPTTGSAWLSFLAKRWNCTGKQFYAFGGTGAYDWLNNSSWGLGKMLADETVYNAYFIAYGHNDSASVGEATDEAAPVTITDGVPSCPGGYSFCAYLKAIVAQIREKAPHAMIFMLSQYDYSVAPGGWHSSYGEAIIDVAEALYAGGDKLVHHLDTGGVPDSDMAIVTHYSTVGYAYIAKRVNDEVNKVMYQYRADTEIKTFGVYNL